MRYASSASLIIAVYKRVDFLELIFQSIEKQSYRDFEIIVAEDDCSPSVKEFVKHWQAKSSFVIKHINQVDEGFRKNKLLNKALSSAQSDYLVFIDGDCILHKDFLKEHMLLAKPNDCLFGRRVMLDAMTTEKMIKTKSIDQLSFFRLLFSKTRHLENAIHFPFLLSYRKSGVLGCNFSVFKEKLIEINGFDEDFQRPLYGEDTDIERRLRLIGVQIKNTKFKTIQYHLHHEMKDRDEDWIISGQLYQKKVNEGKSFCDNGYIKNNTV